MGRTRRWGAAVLALCLGAMPAAASTLCPAEQASVQLPQDPALCASLAPEIRKPSALPLAAYEAKLGTFLRNYCHRDPASGWRTDKTIRDTGPYIAQLKDGKWAGSYFGTHAPVIIWYSPEMFAWLQANRQEDVAARPASPAPVPDGAVMVKEMYPAPASACRDVDPAHLRPSSGAAVMVRDAAAAYDGWFWGWFGWSGWKPDYPAAAGNAPPDMGFGQYCLNCHASAKDNSTFAALSNIKGEPGNFLTFLSQDFFLDRPAPGNFAPVIEHQDRVEAAAHPPAAPVPLPPDAGFLAGLHLPGLVVPDAGAVVAMPSQTYDNVWMKAGAPSAAGQFLTSDQCLGCHSAGSTGLQFDMTRPAPDNKLVNLSPYGTWRTSPMGLAGRDPVFFAQLASETETFHATISPMVQDTCLGCHGVQGQRQFTIDQAAGGRTFQRDDVNAVPFPADNPQAGLANYGALARDGISCGTCHHMVLGEADSAKYRDAPQNRGVAERQALLNPHETGFARSVTGSFLLGPPDVLYGPFAEPKTKPMLHSFGIKPEQGAQIRSSELCGSCHTVHLPIRRGGDTLGYVYEQATYAEWAFSAYRTGATMDGPLPHGAGATPQSCQACHMPSTDAAGHPTRSKIASIQEHSNFPQAEEALGPEDIDLSLRDGFALHQPAGLNLFLIGMAAQFPNLLGIPLGDPMLVAKAVPPLQATEQSILDTSAATTADIGIADIRRDGGRLRATVTVANRTGHRFPSGVGFRRAFIALSVLGADGKTLWRSGATDRTGVIVDAAGKPIAGELWWAENCSARINPTASLHQPHYRVIERQDQAQIYEELVSTPPAAGPAQCGRSSAPQGMLTTSFLSICAPVKDNRLLPHGFLDHAARVQIAAALGAGPDLADDTDPVGVGDDPAYRAGGGDSLVYSIDLASLPAPPAAIEAKLYYQAMPPYFLQDRFCTSHSQDTQRLSYIASRLKLDGTRLDSWKLELAATGKVAIP